MTLGCEFESRFRHTNWDFPHKIYIYIYIYCIYICPTSGERLNKSFSTQIRLHGRRGKGTAESFSREKLRQAPQKEGGEILCDLPPV